MTAQKLWHGRFGQTTDRRVEAFTSSIDIDRRLYAHDITGSCAHCRMLAKCGIITSAEADQLISGLESIQQEIESGHFVFDDRLEDIHMHIENRLQKIVGQVALKLHTARSRNDQVALDIRLFLREAVGGLIADLHALRTCLVDLSDENLDIVMPGYTHLQRAQPILLAHHLMAYYEMFTRDSQRFRESLKRINVMPLGAAALAGTTYPIDCRHTAELLGFPALCANSIDAVADRDFVLEFLFGASICMVHLSRLAEELVLWSSSEFGFLTLPDAFATGSSIMPQKKNPDVPELVRGKSGSVFGHLMAMLTTMKGLPLAYDRDMQEDKKPIFEALDTLSACLGIFTAMLPKLAFKADRMQKAAASGFLNATDMADYLVGHGIPFREAHACVGRAVSYALDKNKELNELSLEELRAFSDDIDQDIFAALSLATMIDRRKSAGGTARGNVEAALAAARRVLHDEKL